jgi:hypothetical protein
MNGALLTLAGIGLLIAATGITITTLGYSGMSAILGMVLAAALTWTPALLALERISIERRNDHHG